MPDMPVDHLRVGTGWIGVTVTGPVDVIRTFRGYSPVLPVRVGKTGLEYILYISAVSIANPLEELRQQNGGRFEGLKFEIRKQRLDTTAPYELRYDH